MTSHATVTLDQDAAPMNAAHRLASEFEGTFDIETIERSLKNSHQQVASHATVATYLPVLAEKISGQRLHALARVEGFECDERSVVLFLC